MEFDVKNIQRMAKKDFEKAWLETGRWLKLKGRSVEWVREKGKSHPVLDLVERLRTVFLNLGFEEVLNPTIVGEAEVYKQYGPEAPVILDRCFYLAELPRPELGLNAKTLSNIRRLIPSFTDRQVEELCKVFRAYKEGKVEGGSLAEELVEKLGLAPEQATALLGLFPELLKLQPKPTKQILRSHMTALWFPTLAELQHKRTLPLKVFSIGLKYRREQKLDPLHLYESLVASAAVLAADLTLEDGSALTRHVLAELGFEEVRFAVKKATGKYYAPQTEMEVFVRSGEDWIEVGDQGLYSPVALANYNIAHPVFNVGLGVERLAMLLHGEKDIRRLSYPQFYEKKEYSDEELARMVEVDEKPRTEEGKKIMDAIVQTALTHACEKSPCRFTAFKGEVSGRKLEVTVFEPDPKAMLLGPAALNTIYVYQGNILGIPRQGLGEDPLVGEAREHGVSTGIRYLEAVAAGAAAKIERMLEKAQLGKLTVRVRLAKQPSDVNVKLQPSAQRYITGRNKRIHVKGPTFIGIEAVIS
ncbi:O-phosphoserine--tRNA ligase [Candidatus Hecatella orcuttiae]|jgi:O-phosphoseryl-tRNA synthetase|uniref:O-phosphoserine--tRNA ligase n=1 Tax=Candidatus Hecatella orcuttiae TaxID=1935119 RepID=UPI0028681634|nr:O-phosphoserine--tRNA ligase [Candidatus Hecatella orcuttiae]